MKWSAVHTGMTSLRNLVDLPGNTYRLFVSWEQPTVIQTLTWLTCSLTVRGEVNRQLEREMRGENADFQDVSGDVAGLEPCSLSVVSLGQCVLTVLHSSQINLLFGMNHGVLSHSKVVNLCFTLKAFPHGHMWQTQPPHAGLSSLTTDACLVFFSITPHAHHFTLFGTEHNRRSVYGETARTSSLK